MKTKQKMLTKPITAGFASIFYFKSVKDGILTLMFSSYKTAVLKLVMSFFFFNTLAILT